MAEYPRQQNDKKGGKQEGRDPERHPKDCIWIELVFRDKFALPVS
jgi:hypothetical protein